MPMQQSIVNNNNGDVTTSIMMKFNDKKMLKQTAAQLTCLGMT